LGVGADVEDISKEFMFEAGHTNEDSWRALLEASGILPSDLLAEEQVPISWTLPSGRLVTGRPDFIIHAGGKPVRGLELKQVSSLWTGRDVALKGRPKLMHLLQAAHYFIHCGAPEYEVWYTSRANFALPSDYKWGPDKKWPRPGQPGAEYMSMGEEGYPIALLPFIVGYELRWVGDSLEYRRLPERAGQAAWPWVQTVVTRAGIRAYYLQVDRALTQEVLPPVPVNLLPSGESDSYSACKYCPLKSVCAGPTGKEGAPFRPWIEEVKRYMATLPSIGTI
jgi:hypothetical protein